MRIKNLIAFFVLATGSTAVAAPPTPFQRTYGSPKASEGATAPTR